jgi:tetratricopeptide (TPR) repeat protein
VRALHARQFLLRVQNRFAEAEAPFEEALAIVKPWSGDPFPELANMLHTHAEVKTLQNDFAAGERWAREAVSVHRRLHGLEHPATAWALRSLGEALHKQGRLRDAQAAYRESLAIFSKSYGGNHKSTRIVRDGLKTVLHDLKEADALVNVAHGELDEINARLADGWFERAKVHAELGEWGRAIEAYQQALELTPADKVNARGKVASACRVTADQAAGRADRRAAESGYRLVVSALETSVGEHSTPVSLKDLGRSCLRLGGLLCDQGRLEAGEAFYGRAIRVFQQGAARFPDDPAFPRFLGRGYRDMTHCLARQGKRDAALITCRESIRTYAELRQAFPTDPYYLDLSSYAARQLASLLKEAGDKTQSLAELRAAAALFQKGATEFPDYKGVNWMPPEVGFFQVHHWRCQAEIALHLVSDSGAYREAAIVLLDPQFKPTDKRASADAMSALKQCLSAAENDRNADPSQRAALIDRLRQRSQELAELLRPAKPKSNPSAKQTREVLGQSDNNQRTTEKTSGR